MLEIKCEKTAAWAGEFLDVTKPQIQTWMCPMSSVHMPDPMLAKKVTKGGVLNMNKYEGGHCG